MIARSRSIAAGMLLILTLPVSQAAARGVGSGADPPWNPEHISMLPAEVRSTVQRLCGPSLQAAHYFATYSENSRFLNLHFEKSRCGSQNVCTQAGCLHQVYVLSHGRYRLLRSYFGSPND